MRTRKHQLRTAVAVGVSALAIAASGTTVAKAETVDTSGHKVCPAGQQVRVWSVTQGDNVKHHWYSDNGTYGTDEREIGVMGADTQTFTLQRDVYWRVVVEGPRTSIAAGAECY